MLRDAAGAPLEAFCDAYLSAAAGGDAYGGAAARRAFAFELQLLVPFGLLYSPHWNHPRARPSPALELARRAAELLERARAAPADDALRTEIARDGAIAVLQRDERRTSACKCSMS